MNDLYAIQLIQRGDSGGLAVLVERYQARAVRAAYAITQDRAAAEDVVQTAFLQLFNTLRTFDPQRPFEPWFYRSVVNAAVRVAQKTQIVVSLNSVLDTDTGDTFAELLPDLAALPVEQIEHAERTDLIRDALGKLTPEQRAAVVMRYYLGMETNEISAELECPPATIRWRLHTALKRLRGLLPAWVEE